MKNSPKRQQGFTLIELLIATLVFAVVLIVILSAFVQISRLFYKGVNLSRTQEDSRQIVQDVADDITFAQTAPSPASFNAVGNADGSSKTGYFCIGLHRYDYNVGHQLGTADNDYALKRTTIPASAGCNNAVGGTNPVELLDDGMQLNNLSVDCTGGLCRLKIHVIFFGGTPQDLFATANSSYNGNPWMAPDAHCTGNLVDSQYCATADYASAVLQRP